MKETKNVQDPSEVLIEEKSGTVSYGGKDYEIKPLGVAQILKILKIVQKSEKEIREKIKEDFEKAKEDVKKEMGKDYVSDKDIPFETLDAVVSALEVLSKGDIYKIIGVIFGISEKKAEEGFKLSSVMEVLLLVIDQEEIDKLFLGMTTLGNKLSNLKIKV